VRSPSGGERGSQRRPPSYVLVVAVSGTRHRHHRDDGRSRRGDRIKKDDDDDDDDAAGEKEGERRKKDKERRDRKRKKKKPAATKPNKPSPPEVKSILKKKNRPIPINQFGKIVNNNPGDFGDNDDDDDDDGGDSDPDMIEEKSVANNSSSAAPTTTLQLGNTARGDDNDDVKSVGTAKSASTARSGLRSGKYASLNRAYNASREDADVIDEGDEEGGKHGSQEEEDDDDEDYLDDDDYTAYSNYLNEADEINSHHTRDNGDDDDSSDRSSSDSDERTLKSIKDDRTTEMFDRSSSHFLRTADLGLTQDTIFAEQFLDDPKTQKPEPHYHHPSPHPPPGVQFHIDENWVCLDNGKGSHSPIAPQAVDALVAMGYRAACDPMMWTPVAKTRKYMTEKGLRFDDIPVPGPMDEGEGGAGDSTCLVWSGKFPHKYHGHEQPAVRSQGIVNMSPEDLVDLLMDSQRVSEYNKSSIGREDEVILSDGTDLDGCPFSGQRKKKLTGVVVQGAKIVDGTATFDSETDDEQTEEEILEEVYDDDGHKSVHTITTRSRRERPRSSFVGVTKLVRTTNKPPLVRRVLEFFTLLHCRALTDEQGGDGYIIVGRGIIPASEYEKTKKGVMRSEILLNVHIVRRLRTEKQSRRDRSGGGKSRSGGRSSKSVSTSGRKAGKADLTNRCLMINVNHLKSPMVPNMLAKKVGLSAALNFITDIRALAE